jgi:hypothetical protein
MTVEATHPIWYAFLGWTLGVILGVAIIIPALLSSHATAPQNCTSLSGFNVQANRYQLVEKLYGGGSLYYEAPNAASISLKVCVPFYSVIDGSM